MKGFGEARVVVWAVVTAAAARLDLAARARLAVALAQAGDPFFTRAVDTEAWGVFCRERPEVTPPDASLRLLRRLGRDADFAGVLEPLAVAAALENRVTWTWPELLLGASILDVEHGLERLTRLIAEPPSNLLDIARGLAAGMHQGGLAEVHEEDDVGRLLFVGPDGAPTTSPTRPTLARDTFGDVRFRAPPEMQREPYVHGYSRKELWERHFIGVPHGDRKLEAWVTDGRNAVTHHEKNPPLMRRAIHDPARELSLLSDIELVLAEVLGLEELHERLTAMAAVPTALVSASQLEGILAARQRAQRALGEARRLLFDGRAQLGAGGAPSPDYQGRFDDERRSLSSGLRRSLAARTTGTLLARIELGESIAVAIDRAEAPRLLGTSLRPAIAAALDELVRAMPDARHGTDRDRIVQAVFEAQAIAERGSRALSSSLSNDASSVEEASRMADELAVLHLRHAFSSEAAPVRRAVM